MRRLIYRFLALSTLLAALTAAPALALATLPEAPGSFDLNEVPLPAGTLPMYVADPVLPANAGDPVGFGCFGACGPSCACAGRVDGQLVTHFNGMACQWKTIQCYGHSFCTWHDTCYSRCDFQYPGKVDDGSLGRPLCYRACDLSCINGADPAPISGSWNPASLDPGPPPEALGAVQCALRLGTPGWVTYESTLTYAQLQLCAPE